MSSLTSFLKAVIKGRLKGHRVSFNAGFDGSWTVVGSGGDIFDFVVRLNIHILFVEVELSFEVEEVEHGTLGSNLLLFLILYAEYMRRN